MSMFIMPLRGHGLCDGTIHCTKHRMSKLDIPDSCRNQVHACVKCYDEYAKRKEYAGLKDKLYKRLQSLFSYL